MSKVNYETIDAYYRTCDPPYIERMEELRKLAKSLLPTMEEGIRWGIPTIFYNGSIFQMCQCKTYVQFAPGKEAIQHFQRQLKDYTTTTCAIHLPLDQPIPKELLISIIVFCKEQNESKH